MSLELHTNTKWLARAATLAALIGSSACTDRAPLGPATNPGPNAAAAELTTDDRGATGGVCRGSRLERWPYRGGWSRRFFRCEPLEPAACLQQKQGNDHASDQHGNHLSLAANTHLVNPVHPVFHDDPADRINKNNTISQLDRR